MWGRMHGEPKMSVAKNILQDVSYWFPEDLDLALRAYGSTSPSESSNCSDSMLLVPFTAQNREAIRHAISGLRPLGQTPIAYALNQAGRDFGARADDRAVVLVTDGIESCGGDPAWAAKQLREQGIIVHVIGFGFGNAKDEDTASLRAIANASGGRYVTAGSAEELKIALAETVATSYSIFKGSTEVASGSLGSGEPTYLPEGDYRVVLNSSPPQQVPVSLSSRDSVKVTLEKRGDFVSHVEQRDQMEYRSCEDVVARIERLEDRAEQPPSVEAVDEFSGRFQGFDIDRGHVVRFVPGRAHSLLDHPLQVRPLAVGLGCLADAAAELDDRVDAVREYRQQVRVPPDRVEQLEEQS
jgi:hypothetical protein